MSPWTGKKTDKRCRVIFFFFLKLGIQVVLFWDTMAKSYATQGRELSFLSCFCKKLNIALPYPLNSYVLVSFAAVTNIPQISVVHKNIYSLLKLRVSISGSAAVTVTLFGSAWLSYMCLLILAPFWDMPFSQQWGKSKKADGDKKYLLLLLLRCGKHLCLPTGQCLKEV